MKRAKLLGMCIGLTNTKALTSTRQLGLNSLTLLTQVNLFSVLTKPPSLLSSPINPNNNYYNNFNLHQKLLFSSKIQSFVHLLSSRDCFEEIEVELEKLVPKVTHEFLVYGLMKLNRNPQKSLDFFNWACVKKGFDPSYVPYSLLLRSLACYGFEKDFWGVASKMQEKGFYIDSNLNSNVIADLKIGNMNLVAYDWSEFYKELCDVYNGDEVAKYVVNSVLGSDWSEEVEGELKKKLEFPLSENFILRVLREVSKQPLRALKFFKWVGSCGGYEHNTVTYNAMIKVLDRPESINEFWEVVEKMRSERFQVDFDSLIKILRFLPVVDAVKVFEFMMDYSIYKLSEPECLVVLKCISEESNPDMDLAHRVVNRFVASGNTISKKIYDRMHKILCINGNFDEAKKIVKEMRNAGYKADKFTYDQQIFGLCRHKRFKEACKLLDKMEAEGCVVDIKTWTILLQGHCSADQVDEAVSLFFKMIEKNVHPDNELLTVMINGFLSQNKILGAYNFFVEIVNIFDKRLIKPSRAVYKVLIEKLAEVGQLKEAVKLLKMMKEQHPPFPDPVFQYISKNGTVEDAKNVIKVLPDKRAFSIKAHIQVIKSFFEEGRESEAIVLIHNSPSRVRSHKEIRNMMSSAAKQMSFERYTEYIPT